jgi:hypothetical protein
MSSIASSSAAASSTAVPKAPPQGGVLEGVNPVHFDAKNPIILFIVQASCPALKIVAITTPFRFALAKHALHVLNVQTSHDTNQTPGLHHHHLLPRPPLAALQDPPASRYL